MRKYGGVPATIGVLNGVARVGFEADQLIELLESAGKDTTLKISRRDLGYVCGLVREFLCGVVSHDKEIVDLILHRARRMPALMAEQLSVVPCCWLILPGSRSSLLGA